MFSNAFFYEVHDKVRIEMDRETRSWVGGRPDGEIGTVVGWDWYIEHSARYGLDLHSTPVPGIYEQRGSVIVLWRDGTRSSESWNIKPVDQDKYERLRRERWLGPMERGADTKKIEHALTRRTKIGELPKTDFWEGDIVYTNFKGALGRITSIKYEYLDSYTSDGTKPMHEHALYDFRFCDENGTDIRQGGSSCGTKNSRLFKRGNVWKYYNDEPLMFVDLMQEVGFYRGLHQYDEVRNPATKMFNWTGKEALEAVRAGLADGFNISGVLNLVPPSPHPFRFHDRNLGERVRAATMEGFAGVVDPDVKAA